MNTRACVMKILRCLPLHRQTIVGCYWIEAMVIPFSNFTYEITEGASDVTSHVHFLCFLDLLMYTKEALDLENITRILGTLETAGVANLN